MKKKKEWVGRWSSGAEVGCDQLLPPTPEADTTQQML